MTMRPVREGRPQRSAAEGETSPSFLILIAALVIFCIGFFMRDDRMVAKNKRQSFVKVIDRDMFICKRSNPQARKTLFLKVSIIAILGVLKRK